MIIKKCEICSSEFKTANYLIKKGHGRFCSIKCRAKKIMVKREKTGTIKKCNFCGKDIYIEKYKLNKNGNYCSKKCNSKSKIGKLFTNKIGKYFPCNICKKEMYVAPWMIRDGGGKFCSNKCYGEWRAKTFSGENSPYWKGGITPINTAIRTSREYYLWRKAVIARDGKKCLWCGSKERLEVDHIKPFALFPELRFAIDNGRVLCRKCHETTDTYCWKVTKLKKTL